MNNNLRFKGIALLLLLCAVCLAPGSLEAAGWSKIQQQGQVVNTASDTIFNQTDNRGRKQGHWKKVYRNGRVAYRAQFCDGHPIGRTLRYNEDGILIADLRHDRTGRRSRARIYDDKGNLIAEGNYCGQLKDSVWTLYSDGRVTAREGYECGVKNGIWEWYSDAGRLAIRERWQAGKQEGKQEEYFDNGSLRYFWTARNGMEDGPSATLYTSGRPQLKGQFQKGKRTGIWVLYDVDGTAKDTLEFRDGDLVRSYLKPNVDNALRQIYQNAGKIQEPTGPGGENGNMRRNSY